MVFRPVDPSTGEPLDAYEETTAAEGEAILESAYGAFAKWRRVPVARRAKVLHKAARLIRRKRETLAKRISIEMGKPITQSRAEVEKCAWVCDHYAKAGPALLATRSVQTEASQTFVQHRPMGVVLGIMPWNFPMWQAFRFAAPAIMAGNAVLLKPAPNVPGCAKAIEEIWEEALGEGLFQVILVPEAAVARYVGDPRVRAVSFTGSVEGGQSVAALAGHHGKKVVLELGGSDPFIVFDDADMDAVLESAVAARCQNAGQSCIAAKRFIVEESVMERFVKGFQEQMDVLIMGDPTDDETQIGPIAREETLDTLRRQVQASVAAGAEILTGGQRVPVEGFFYPPTALVGVPTDAPAWTEEVFGPVAAIVSFDGEREAVELANDSDYGLGASIWTEDVERAKRVSALLDAGMIFVNEAVRSDPRLPFGGVKDSGFGRELGPEGLLEFTEPTVVWVQ